MRRRRRRSDKKATWIQAIAGTLTSALRTTPIIILLVALVILWQREQMPAGFLNAIPSTAFFILVLGMVLTFYFNRSRVFFMLFILFVSFVGLMAFPADNINSQLPLHALYALTGILIPLNLLFFFSLPERGILSIWGKRHFGIIFFQVFFAAGIVASRDQDIIAQLNSNIFMLPVLRTPLSDIAILVFTFVGVMLFVKRYKGSPSFKIAVWGSLIAVALSLHFQLISYALPLFFASAGLMLILSVIQDSYSMAYHDELTELFSRRALNEELMRLGGNYVIAMLDVDHFKKFNDTHGHDAGDDVLRLVASHMKNVTGGGKAFRYGGEEFTILFPGKSISEIMPYLEQLRERIAKYEFILRRHDKQKKVWKKLHVTISIGVAEAGENQQTPEEVLKKADAALYRAKEKGRNCICS